MVLLKEVLADKPFQACLTFEWLLLLMSESVFLEVASVVELLATELTCEDVAAFVVGRDEVRFESGSPPKSPIAKFTFPFLLISMEGHVCLQKAFISKCL